MSNSKIIVKESNQKGLIFWIVGFGLLMLALLVAGVGYFILKSTALGLPIANAFSWLFALNSTQTTWYITRAAGWVAYFLLWFSMVWGLAIPTKFFERVLSPTFAVDFHEYISLLSLGFIFLHVGALLVDQYLPFTLAQILVPFFSTYRPVWVGFGTIGFYLMALVTVTFYLRKKIGQKAFKSIHLLSLLSYLGVVLHAFFAGSDSSIGAVQVIYFVTFMIVVFLTAYWLIHARDMKKKKETRLIISKSSPLAKR